MKFYSLARDLWPIVANKNHNNNNNRHTYATHLCNELICRPKSTGVGK